ncbi:MCP four helix bundle domain-containing protein [Magnetospirillum moscoviense]|uniref:Chemotaxis protein n=1 Tax=Magnetospirillum moscoviense TaxID=1437059 RepID=A0A178MPS0_9PROT|nr:MCP four helix bundle domain-containing protein [Magnetospirillum moscoviense]OAN50553.1 chemotaxis protein [Magnetospirillum moscoviense]
MKTLISSVERLTLTTKLVIGFSTGIVAALVIGLNALSGLSALEAEMERMYQNDLLGISHIKDANLNLIYMSRSMRHMLIAQDQVVRDSAMAQIKRAREKLLVDLTEARKRIYRPEVIDRFNSFQNDLNKALEGIEHAVVLISREEMRSSAAAQYITSPEFGAAVAKADQALHDLVEIKERAADASLDQAREESRQVKVYSIILLLAGIVVSVFAGIVIGLSIQRPNNRLRNSVEDLAAGNVDVVIPHTDYPNEIGVMARAVGVLQTIYRKANDQHWVKSHVAEVSAALQQAEDFGELTQVAVSKMAPTIGAGHGAFYVADRDGRYNLRASYGYRERKHLSNGYMPGEGLVGQCVLERSTIMLTAPKDYIRINSGLGEGPPACVVVLPVMHGDRVLGVLEMASFQQIGDRERAVLDGLLPALSASMEILDRNLRTKELLAATQEQAERMEKQAAQLEEQQVEMEAQQSELLETENWFRSIIETAPDGMLVADAKGRILLTNPPAETMFGYEAGELIGNGFDQLFPVRLRDPQGGLSQQILIDHPSRVIDGGADIVGLRKDGAEFPMVIAFSPLPPRGSRGKCISVSVRPRAVS